jgi:hypothetical protein
MDGDKLDGNQLHVKHGPGVPANPPHVHPMHLIFNSTNLGASGTRNVLLDVSVTCSSCGPHDVSCLMVATACCLPAWID